MPDYHDRIRSLRALGAEGSGATEPERRLANAKADELEAKYGKPPTPVPESSRFTDDTTTTSRDGRAWRYDGDGRFNPFARPPTYTPGPPPPGGWDQYMQDLLARQHMWNGPDPDDLIDEQYKYDDDDEDYGYDIYEGEDPFNA